MTLTADAQQITFEQMNTDQVSFFALYILPEVIFTTLSSLFLFFSYS